jgi:predicted phosphoribosyltransferase/CBS domain-containing protein
MNPPFRDRRHAGQRLAPSLLHLQDAAPLVLALPRGGVPVAYEVALALRARLDVLLVRKLGAPGCAELGLGAVVEGPVPQRVLNQEVIESCKPPPGYLAAEEQRQLYEIERRRKLYCGGRPLAPVRGRTVIVVDDGVATGATLKSALIALAQAGARRLVFAVPVAPRGVLKELRKLADEGICLLAPHTFRAVSPYYADFLQTGDEEVIALLRAAAHAATLVPTEKENTMRAISEVMTQDVTLVSPQDDLAAAAQLMRDRDVGALPVCDGKKLVGMITDRDITVRAVASGKPAQEMHVADVMSTDVRWAFADQTVGEVLQEMGDVQIRRIPVVDRDMNMVGIVALADIAVHEAADLDDTLEEISQPGEPNHPPADEVRLRKPPTDQADGRF